ncbi:MAG: serine/threonine-protein phosphatase [Anaerolineae bacterium]|nr:serine/threonine-protein phosphatase [Anaerolineae bacterium]
MTASESSQIEAFGLSDVGRVREDNQDAIRLCQTDDPLTLSNQGHLYAIADGMGGYSHGGLASATALEVFFAAFYSTNGAQAQIKQAVQQANIGVYQTAQRLGAVRMGTTLSAINLVGNQLTIAHVGDSRVYLVRDRSVTCLTSDHTMVGELVRMKVLPPEKVRSHAQRSVLNKCLGFDLFVQPDVSRVTVQEGDMLILCTDGAWSVIEDHEFAELSASVPNVNALSHEIVQLAAERGSDDNASAIAVHIQHLSADAEPVSQRRGLFGFLRGRPSVSL